MKRLRAGRLVMTVALACCARSVDDSLGPSDAPFDGGPTTAPPASSAPSGGTGPRGTAGDDASATSAAPDADVDAGFDGATVEAGGGGGGLDPSLDLPGAGGPVCPTPGSESGCPSLTVCRIASATGGRCEGCTSCGNLNTPCARSSDCDILFQCFEGVCTNICPLGTSYCGPVADCLDVGNASYGVCRPGA